jgi:hypothetical protein
MLYGFIGRVSQAASLKQGLDLGTQRTRAIADRVAKATVAVNGAAGDGFALPDAATAPGTTGAGEVDIEAEMVSLADEQLRFEATARLLEKTYQRIRIAMKERG